jgi:TonB-dependent starch-binding outer membrane protein SusC
MKKITELSGDMKFPGLKKLFRIMKLTTFLILFSVVCVFASESYSQSKKLNLNMKNVAVKDVLSAIEDQSEFKFMYSGKVVDVNREVAINEENSKIEDVLKTLFAGTDVNYTIRERFIVLSSTESINYELSVFQQQKSISGKVTDSSGASLPGVSVVVKGTTNGTISDGNGNYSLSNVPENAILQFSFVGMKGQEIAVGGKSTINVTLEDVTIGIEEVVAIGYGTQKKANLTGAVSSIKTEDISKMPVTGIANLIQGRAAGVQIVNSSGDPRSNGTIIIRGVGNIRGMGPLYVIDGVPALGTTGFNMNMKDIADIQVLRDASSSAIYGARAAGGVILITTKRGSSGEKWKWIFLLTMDLEMLLFCLNY